MLLNENDDYTHENDNTNTNYRWKEVKSKSVPDSDGFSTDYTMYTDGEKFVFIFGDRDLYNPDNTDFDWEVDTKGEADEWFDNYEGFAEDEEDDDPNEHFLDESASNKTIKNWYEKEYPDDTIAIEQIEDGITFEDIKNNPSLLDPCDTQVRERILSYLNKDLKEQLVSDSNTPEGPIPGPDTGVSNLLISAINGEWSTIQQYNDLITTLASEGMNDIAEIIKDINNEENVHVGQLQKALETLSPNIVSVHEGEKEAEDKVKTLVNNIDESLSNLEKIDNPVVQVPFIMADAQQVSKRNDEKIQKALSDADALPKQKPFLGTKGETTEMPKTETLKKMHLSESLFEAVIDDDGEEYDMHEFITDLFTRGARFRKPVNPLDHTYRKFNYVSGSLGADSGNETNTSIHADRNGDVVLEAASEDRFDEAKAICDKYQLYYDINPSRFASKNKFKTSMTIEVPFGTDGNPVTVEDYFNELGIDPTTVVTGQDTKKYSKKPEYNKGYTRKASNESFDTNMEHPTSCLELIRKKETQDDEGGYRNIYTYRITDKDIVKEWNELIDSDNSSEFKRQALDELDLPSHVNIGPGAPFVNYSVNLYGTKLIVEESGGLDI